MTGIYKITNKINGKSYIGQSINIEHRWYRHIHEFVPYPLHRAIEKYGEESFDFSVLEECNVDSLDEREKYWINYYDSYNNGYNLTLGGKGITYYKKLNCEEVDEIIDLLINSSLQIKQIAEKFEVSEVMINNIRNGISWKKDELVYPLRPTFDIKGEKNHRAVFSKDEVLYIRKQKSLGFKPSQIHKQFADRIILKGFYKVWNGERYTNI